jgi:ABC-type antimicrobial peptide transport system permease subunit
MSLQVGTRKHLNLAPEERLARDFVGWPIQFWVPARQNFSVRVNLSVRTSRDAAGLAAALTREVRALDANLAPSELITMRQHIDQTALASQQVAVALLSVFGGLALLLAAVGLYGVMSYAVSQSTRELGLRMALGAGPANLLRLVMSQGLTLTAIGLLLGAVAALGLTRLMGNLLYQMSPRDPVAFAAAFAVMMIVSVGACLLPAWRAAQIDPIRALRD